MTRTEHIERHILLHEHFDELLADFITHTGKLPTKTSLTEFISWAFQQTIEPDLKPGEEYESEH